jgi:hypothetical protein
MTRLQQMLRPQSASTKMTERILIALTVLLALGIPVGTYVVLRLLGF